MKRQLIDPEEASTVQKASNDLDGITKVTPVPAIKEKQIVKVEHKINDHKDN